MDPQVELRFPNSPSSSGASAMASTTPQDACRSSPAPNRIGSPPAGRPGRGFPPSRVWAIARPPGLHRRHAIPRAPMHPHRRLAVEPGAYRRDLGDTPSEPMEKQSDNDHQDVMDPTHPRAHPAHRARKCDRIGANRVRRSEKAQGPLGPRHHLLKLVQCPRQPGRKKVRQQAERGVALGAVPASDARPARGLTRVGARRRGPLMSHRSGGRGRRSCASRCASACDGPPCDPPAATRR